jgi:hypothetical protein
MKIHTNELSGMQLSYAVAVAEKPNGAIVVLDLNSFELKYFWGHDKPYMAKYSSALHFDSDWGQCGPIIEREKIAIDYDHDTWNASIISQPVFFQGDTPQEAAMRCFVVYKLGDEVEIPDHIAKHLKTLEY